MSMFERMWEFETARFRVIADIAPDDSDPSESFDDPETVAAIHSGVTSWFWARVRVLDKETNRELGVDALHGCAYDRPREFFEAHRDADPMNRNCSIMWEARGYNVSICHYFPGMVRQAIADARETLGRLSAVPLRATA